MKKLELNLDCKIVTVSSQSLGYSYSNPVHVKVSVSSSLTPDSVKKFNSIVADYEFKLKSKELFRQFKKWAGLHYGAYRTHLLGSLTNILEHLGTNAFFKTLDIIQKEINDEIKRPQAPTYENSQKLQFLNTSKQILQQFAEDVKNDELPSRAERLYKLFNLLERVQQPEFRGIIFVQVNKDYIIN